MNSDLSGWFIHPVTLGLAGLSALLLFVTVETLLRSLAELGNVRFQGVLDDNPNLFPSGHEDSLHISRLTDVLRWLQIASLGCLWIILLGFPGIGVGESLALGLLLAFGFVVLSRLVVGVLAEDNVALLLRLVRPLAWPLVTVHVRLSGAPRVAPAEDEEEEASDREIQAYLEAGQAAGIFEGEEGEYVESLVDFFDTVVREVMTPRTEVIAVADTTSYRELVETFATTHKSRIPVFTGTIDHVIGVIHVKSLVEYLARGEQPTPSQLANECLVVPESKALGELLSDFQQRHQQMAIVVDEYGGTSGVVTLEDILEEIVGEIRDEHDPKPPPESQELQAGVYRLQGRASLEVLGELFGVLGEEDDVDTVGGLVFSLYGTVPSPGTEVADASRGLLFTVDEMRERRVVSVTVRRSPGAGEPSRLDG